MRVTGRCLCGGVRFQITRAPTPIQACHARRCRRATGGPYALEAGVGADAFRWLEGEKLVVQYEAPLLEKPPAYRRAFCRVCGSPVPLVYPAIGGVGIPPGALDDESGLALSHHAFVAQKAPWLELTDDLPRHDMRPPRPVHEGKAHEPR